MLRSRDSGFSLIELMLVGALAATLAGITVPTIAASLRRYALITASQQVVSTVRSARIDAVAKNRIVEVRFNFPAAGQYQVVAADGTAIGTPMQLPQGAAFGDVSADVEFTTAGRLDPGVAAPVTIPVSNVDADLRTVTVTASGRVEVVVP